VQEFERLLEFWHELTQAFDLDAIRGVVDAYLPEVTGSQDGWVVTGPEDDWRSVLGPASVPTDAGERAVTEVAIEAVARAGISARPDGIEHDGQVCFPMIAAGATVGVLGLPAITPGLTPPRRLLIGAAAALLGVSVRSCYLLDELRQRSLRDALTGCLNRAPALEAVERELMRARRSRLPVSLIMFDLDRFKSINDRHGHQCGDAVLAEVGARMRAALRTSDLTCRYGGEEFLVLLPETPLEGARRVAETLKREVAGVAIAWNGRTVRLTSSFGVAAALPNEIDPMPLIGRADQALYRAKRTGRDCVCLADEPARAVATDNQRSAARVTRGTA